MKCLKCNHDVFALMSWDTLFQEYIECPNCGSKMSVEYDEDWDEENGFSSWWWVEQYEEEL
jgi:DNA-directed RNA polymerase subunit RPC12/RpoP